MSVVKVIEILAESKDSWEDAARQAVEEASRTIHDIKSIYIKEFQATVENGKVQAFRVDAKISFAVREQREAAE